MLRLQSTQTIQVYQIESRAPPLNHLNCITKKHVFWRFVVAYSYRNNPQPNHNEITHDLANSRFDTTNNEWFKVRRI